MINSRVKPPLPDHVMKLTAVLFVVEMSLLLLATRVDTQIFAKRKGYDDSVVIAHSTCTVNELIRPVLFLGHFVTLSQ